MRQRTTFGRAVTFSRTRTTPIGRVSACLIALLVLRLQGWALRCVPADHPWRVFNEGTRAMRREAHAACREYCFTGGIAPMGEEEHLGVTAIKLVALLLLAWLVMSVLFNLGGIDLIGFDLIKIAGSDL